jgi:5-deoxy-glucuronate isomerase
MGVPFKVGPGRGHQVVFHPGERGIRWLGLEVLRLRAGERWQSELDDEEAVLVLLSGRGAISIRGKQGVVRWDELGERVDVFNGPAAAVYAPRRSALEVTGEVDLELAIARAPCEVDLAPALIAPDSVKIVSPGVASWQREVRLIVPPSSSISQRLIVGETLNPPANWSGIPPHKHDRATDTESVLEEFYYFKVKPPDCFGVQVIYEDGQGEAYVVGDDDVIVFLNGYHPTVAAPGATVFYLWALAGNNRSYKIAVDPRFQWVSQAEASYKEKQH